LGSNRRYIYRQGRGALWERYSNPNGSVSAPIGGKIGDIPIVNLGYSILSNGFEHATYPTKIKIIKYY
jgi:hypothetical protein